MAKQADLTAIEKEALALFKQSKTEEERAVIQVKGRKRVSFFSLTPSASQFLLFYFLVLCSFCSLQDLFPNSLPIFVVFTQRESFNRKGGHYETVLWC